MKTVLGIALCACLASCDRGETEAVPGVTPQPRSTERTIPLSTYSKATISVKGKKIAVYVADDHEKQAEGLMFVKDDQLGADEGMIFVFPDEQPRSFWMKNTLIPLDIAYLTSDGTVLNILLMAPLDMSAYPSDGPARYAVEMKPPWFDKNGVAAGDRFDLSGLKN